MSNIQTIDIHGKPYKRGILVAILLIGNFCTVLNQTILSTAFPTLMKTFNVSASTVQWLTTGFMLVNGIMIPISAFLINRFSTKKLYLTAMMIFLMGTLTCGIAPSFPILLLGRIIQALSVGMALPMIQTIMLTIFPPEKRGVAMGMAGIVVGLAPAIGPTLSGWIIDQYNWRYLFMMIVPIAFIVLILALFFMRDVLPNQDIKIDPLSIVLSIIGFGSLLYGFSSVGDEGWTSHIVLISLIIGMIFIALFALRQFKMEEPFLDLSVFKSGSFTMASFASSMIFMMMIGVEMVLPMYIQNIRQTDAFHSGLTLLPGALMVGIMMPIAGKIFDKYGIRHLAITGITLATLGTVPLLFLTTTTPMLFLVVVYAVRMLGIAMTMMPLTTSGMNALPNNKMSHGTAVNNTIRQVMGSIGTAILVSTLSTTTTHSMPAMSLKESQPLLFKEGAINATLTGYHVAFFASIIFGVIGLILALCLHDKKGGKHNG